MEVSAGSRPPPDASGTIPFIVSSSVEKFGPATRKLIRSHARRGKSRKKATLGRIVPIGKRGTGVRQEDVGQARLGQVVEMYSSLVPRRVGSDVSFANLPDEVEPSLLHNMIKG